MAIGIHLQIRGLLSKRTTPEGCWTFHTDNETDAVFKGFFPLKTCYFGVSILNLRGIPTWNLTWQWTTHHLKMDFLLEMGIFQPVMLVFRGILFLPQSWKLGPLVPKASLSTSMTMEGRISVRKIWGKFHRGQTPTPEKHGGDWIKEVPPQNPQQKHSGLGIIGSFAQKLGEMLLLVDIWINNLKYIYINIIYIYIYKYILYI